MYSDTSFDSKRGKGPKTVSENIEEPQWRVYDVSMDIAIPGSDLTGIGIHGGGPRTSELYRNLCKALLSVGYEMAGDVIEVNAERTDDYVNDYIAHSRKMNGNVESMTKFNRKYTNIDIILIFASI